MGRLKNEGSILHREALVLGGRVPYEHSTAQFMTLLQRISDTEPFKVRFHPVPFFQPSGVKPSAGSGTNDPWHCATDESDGPGKNQSLR